MWPYILGKYFFFNCYENLSFTNTKFILLKTKRIFVGISRWHALAWHWSKAAAVPNFSIEFRLRNRLIRIGNLAQPPAPLEVWNPGLSVKGDEQVLCMWSGLDCDRSREIMRFHRGIRVSCSLIVSPQISKHMQKQGFWKGAQKYVSREGSEWLLENGSTWFVMYLRRAVLARCSCYSFTPTLWSSVLPSSSALIRLSYMFFKRRLYLLGLCRTQGREPRLKVKGEMWWEMCWH
jgi:hypothetical protein